MVCLIGGTLGAKAQGIGTMLYSWSVTWSYLAVTVLDLAQEYMYGTIFTDHMY